MPIIDKINRFSKTFELPLVTILIILSFINLALAASIIYQILPKPGLEGLVKAESFPIVKILEPVNNQTVAGEFPVKLAYSGNSLELLKVMIFVDGVLEKEFEAEQNNLDFTIDAAKFSPGPHTLTFKVSNGATSTHNLGVTVNFAKKVKKSI